VKLGQEVGLVSLQTGSGTSGLRHVGLVLDFELFEIQSGLFGVGLVCLCELTYGQERLVQAGLLKGSLCKLFGGVGVGGTDLL
jgi:hypothetical protein